MPYAEARGIGNTINPIITNFQTTPVINTTEIDCLKERQGIWTEVQENNNVQGQYTIGWSKVTEGTTEKAQIILERGRKVTRKVCKEHCKSKLGVCVLRNAMIQEGLITEFAKVSSGNEPGLFTELVKANLK